MVELYMCVSARYRFLELYYYRAESFHKGKTVPARIETVVVFLPDVWSCVPIQSEWDSLQLGYRKQLERKLRTAVTTTSSSISDQDADEQTRRHLQQQQPQQTVTIDEKASNFLLPL